MHDTFIRSLNENDSIQFPDSSSQNFNIKGQRDKWNLTNNIFESMSDLSSYVEVDIRAGEIANIDFHYSYGKKSFGDFVINKFIFLIN